MKKLVILFLTLILISTFALAQENETLRGKASELKDEISSTKLGDIGTGAKEKTESFLDKEITISQLSIFGIEDGTLTRQQLIVFTIFLILTFLIFLEVAVFIPFLDKEIISGDIIPFEMTLRPPFALIFTLIVAVTGTVYSISQIFYGFASTFEIIGKLGAFQIFIWVVLAIILFIIFSWTSKKIKQGSRLGNVEKMSQRMKTIDAINKAKITANE